MKVIFREARFGGNMVDNWSDAKCIPHVGDTFISHGNDYGKSYRVKEVIWLSSDGVEVRIEG